MRFAYVWLWIQLQIKYLDLLVWGHREEGKWKVLVPSESLWCSICSWKSASVFCSGFFRYNLDNCAHIFSICSPSANSIRSEIWNFVFPVLPASITVSNCSLSFIAILLWSCNTNWPLEAPLIQSLPCDLLRLLCFSRSGHWQARDLPGRSSSLWRQRGAAVSQTGGTGRRNGNGSWDGEWFGVTLTDGPCPHRPVLSSPRPADWGAACGDRQGTAAASPQPGHRQRSGSKTLSSQSLVCKILHITGSLENYSWKNLLCCQEFFARTELLAANVQNKVAKQKCIKHENENV